MTPMTDDPLLEHDALGLAALVRAGEVTPDELLDATLARTERLDGTLNAIITECVERARTHAARVDPSTPFAGVPTFLKDLVDLEGTRRTDGSASMLQNVSAASPAWVTAAEVAGLVVAGKTNTPEFASLPVTDNMVFGPTRNPWDPNLSSGGSSGGAAASVAAGGPRHRRRRLEPHTDVVVRRVRHEALPGTPCVRGTGWQPSGVQDPHGPQPVGPGQRHGLPGHPG